MANAIATGTGDRATYAVIDEAPVAAGYWCQSVSPVSKGTKSLFFSFTGGGVATATIQFQIPGDTTWTDYDTDETFVSGSFYIIENWSANTKWRVGVKEGDYSSGDCKIGLCW